MIIVGILMLLFGLYRVVTGLFNPAGWEPQDKIARVGWGIIFALVGLLLIVW